MNTFGEALRDIIAKKGLSVSAAAMELGFRSKTALFRILGDECRIATSKKCMEAARASRLLSLTDEETRELEQAMAVSEVGKHTYVMNGVMRDMIHACPPGEQTEPVAVEGIGGVQTMDELLCACRGLSRLSVTIMGRCSPDILARLYDMAEELHIGSIRHVLAIDERSIEDVQAFAETAFMLFSPIYRLGIVRESEQGEGGWFFRSRMLVISGDNARGERTVYQLTYVGERHYVAYADETGALFAHWAAIGRRCKGRIDYLKSDAGDVASLPFPSNYLRLCEEYMQLEAGREILMMKPDIPVMCIPPDILAASIVEPMGEEAEAYPRLIRRLMAIHEARYENFMTKKKPTHLIVEEAAMRRFAKTGLCADHVYLARAFTPAERRTILRSLLEKTRRNTGLRLWFGRPGMATDGREVTAYDGYGIGLVKPNTSWRMDDTHRDMMLASEFLASSMRDYVHTQVLKNEVLPIGNTVRILEELIELTFEGE